MLAGARRPIRAHLRPNADPDSLGSVTSPTFEDLAERASRRYRSSGITAWRFARGKLLHDPLYRAVWEQRLVNREGTVLDVGCGQGLMLALLAEDASTRSAVPASGGPLPQNPAKRFLVGVETRPRIAHIARNALGGAATIHAADARSLSLPPSRTILIFDVLHMMPAADQEHLLRSLAASLEAPGTLLIREADASAGWRFTCVRFGNRFKGIVNGYSTSSFHFRTGEEWIALLEKLGLSPSVQPMGKGTPFGNVLLTAVKKPA